MSGIKRGPPEPKQRKRAEYGPKMVRRVCEDLARGMTYGALARLRGRPCEATIHNWRRAYPEFVELTDAARAFGAELCADRALEVAEAATEQDVRKAKLHVDTLMQRAALLAPDRWSARGGRPARPEPLEIVFSVRHFEKVIGSDGKAYVRELKPEGET